MRLYDRLKYGSLLEVSELIETIRATDGPIDWAIFKFTQGRPSGGSHTPHITTLCNGHAHQASIGRPPEKPHLSLLHHRRATTEKISAGISIDPDLHIHSVGPQYQRNFPAPKSASRRYGVADAACTGFSFPRRDYINFQTTPQPLYPGKNQNDTRCQRTRCSPPMILVAQDRAPFPLQVPRAIHRSPERSYASDFAASSTAMQDSEPTGIHEDAVLEYVSWQTRRVCTEEWRHQFVKAGEILLERGFGLKLFYQTKSIDLLLDQGVSRGIALSFHSDIPHWLSNFCLGSSSCL